MEKTIKRKTDEKMKITGCIRVQGLLFGGNANNGANAGSAYANSNNAPSNTNANIGSHLC